MKDENEVKNVLAGEALIPTLIIFLRALFDSMKNEV